MTIKFKLTNPTDKKVWPTIPACEPFLANNRENINHVIIRVDKSYIFFEENYRITQTSDREYLENEYEFIRFLTKDDSITFTG